MDPNLGMVIAITTLIGITTVIFFIIRKILFVKPEESETQIDSQSNGKVEHQTQQKPGKKKLADVKKNLKATYTDSWLMTSLKGHTGDVTGMDFDSSGKHLASCSEDGTVLLWNCKDFDQKEHKHARGKVEYDHGLRIKWSPDSKAFIVYKGNGNCVEVYKIGKKADGKFGEMSVALTFPEKHNNGVVGMGISNNGKFIMTCASDNDLIIWSLRGEVLAHVNLNLAITFSAIISPCGRFVAASGFTPDVKVFEIVFTKSGGFEKVERAFELKGHTSGVYSVAFNTDSTKMATVSKDKTWKMFDTNIEYRKGQEARLLFSQPFDCRNNTALIAMSPDGRTVAIALQSDISFFSGVTGQFVRLIQNVHNGDITCLLFDPSNRLLLSSGDRQIRVFHNVVGYMAAIEDLEQKKKAATHAAMKERIVDQIEEAKKILLSFGDF